MAASSAVLPGGEAQGDGQAVGPRSTSKLEARPSGRNDHTEHGGSFGQLPTDYWKRAKRGVKSAWFIILGNTIEWYEFSLYGYLSPQMATNFFSNSAIGAWAGFGITFVARPIGAVLLGWVGDVCGRRVALLISLAGMVVCTVAQGCVPSSYCCGDTAGTIGLVLLLIFRFCQGLCTGGEIAGVSTYLAEHKDKGILGMLSATLGLGGSAGFLSASAFVLFLHLILTDDQMNLYGWRIPFIFSVIPGTLSLLGRRYLEETGEFMDMLESERRVHGLIANAEMEPQDDIQMYSLPTSTAAHSVVPPGPTEKNLEAGAVSEVSIASSPMPVLNSAQRAAVNFDGRTDLTPETARQRPLQSPSNTLQSSSTPSLHHRHAATIQMESTAGSTSDMDAIVANGAVGAQARRQSKPGPKRSRYPICTLLLVYPVHTLIGFLGMAAYSSIWYVSFVYSLDFLQQQQKVSADQALAMGVICNTVNLVLWPLSGMLVDKYGVGLVFLIGEIMFVFTVIPGWLWLIMAPSSAAGFVVLFVWGLTAGIFTAAPYYWSAELFSTNVRSSGFLAYNLCVGVFGGCGPLICAALVEGWSKFGPLVYQGAVIVMSVIVAGAAYFAHKRGKINIAHIRKTPY